ncbi:MAG: TMEM175 family protein [Chloroflexota bacterium]
MERGRLEAFSDGVMAIIITIMVLELAPPKGTGIGELVELWPVFFAYALSFLHVGIYWSNHHHLFQAVKQVDGRVLWANLFLLFWLSLLPFATAWMGENGFPPVPVAIYGLVLLLCAVAYYLLWLALKRVQPEDAPLTRAIGTARKERLSLLVYTVATPMALLVPIAAIAGYIAVSLAWFLPDPRIEHTLDVA